ncbi:MAG: CopD family protein [Bacteroidia bacterium]|nr:CopD family protein [Bacteroidia bacterium]
MQTYLLFKTLHIVFVVSWFAGLFYLVRLFIYTREAQEKPEPEKTILTHQLLLMQKKLLYIITIPAMVLTLIFGIGMLFFAYQFLFQSWMISKLIGVFFLLIYQWYAYKIYLMQKQMNFRHSSLFLRIFNEGATILLLAIVFLAVFKTSTDFTRYFVFVFIFLVLILIFVLLYRKKQNIGN